MQNILKSGRISTNVLVKASFLVGLSIILTRVFAFMIPLAGLPALRISFGMIPIVISGILFGPVVGGITGAVADFAGFLLNPMGGGYFPGFTLSSALAGWIPGIMYLFIRSKERKLNYNFLNSIVILLFAASVVFVMISKDVLSLNSGRIFYNENPLPVILIFLYLLLVGIFIMIPLILTKTNERQSKSDKYSLDKIIFVVTLNELFVSLSLNTIWLSIMFNKGFLVFLPGRILASFVMIPLHSFIIYTVSRFFKYVEKY